MKKLEDLNELFRPIYDDEISDDTLEKIVRSQEETTYIHQHWKVRM